MRSFWHTLAKPILVLAPMADVTDSAFRRVIAKYGKPDALWTEFVSADGLYHTREVQRLPDSENPLMRDLAFDESERPVVAQLFSATPEMMRYGGALAAELGFDGIDINMGCPDRSVEKQGAGAALLKNPERARALIRAAKEGGGGLPVSVKTRVGYNRVELDSWLPALFAEQPALITVHARTRKEMSLVPARWEHVKKAVALRDAVGVETLIIGNGDVETPNEARLRARESGADGVMIGRAIFGNPWLFSGRTPTHAEKLHTLVEHCALFEQLCRHKGFAVMKKHFKEYIHGFSGAKNLRMALMECENSADAARVVERHLGV